MRGMIRPTEGKKTYLVVPAITRYRILVVPSNWFYAKVVDQILPISIFLSQVKI